jgi:hypothetical protein
MHYIIIVEDCGRECAQRGGGIGVNLLPNYHPFAGAFIRDFVGLDVLHSAHESSQVEIGVGMPGCGYL